MLRSAFGSDRVMKNLYFPVPTRQGVFDTEVDIICITRGGIAVIEVKGSKGIIDTPKDGRWCQRYGKKERYFENPFYQNQTHAASVKRALENAGITNVPIYNYVVFTDIKVKFTHNYPWLVRSDRLLELTEKLDDRLILTRRDVKNIALIMRRHKRPKHPTFKTKMRRENQRKGKRR
ncbi:MAG: NERD domain-containing protein [Clostridia bacterium]|nr:NERD domain-containing protein [Clostridia bacterium]